MSNSRWISKSLSEISKARIAILGEFCLDIYWPLSEDMSEMSLETGLPVHRVLEQRFSLGGAANVAANLNAIGIAKLTTIGAVGTDPFGERLTQLLNGINADTTGLVRDQSDWQTCVYAKRYIGSEEQNRIDFGGFNRPTESTIDRLIALIFNVVSTHDILIVNQQIPRGLFTDKLIEAINNLAIDFPKFKIIVDSRHFSDRFRNVSLKINSTEAMRLVSNNSGAGPSSTEEIARQTYDRMLRPIFITCGDRGIVAADRLGVHSIPGIQISPPIDIVGAGDTALAAVAAAIATDDSDESAITAARLANIAATVSLRKLRETGTASPTEILIAASDPDYVYFPELADNLRLATYEPASEIEKVRRLPDKLAIRHAIFDHDGTLSTLREGWESIMLPMMVRAITGDSCENLSQQNLNEVTRAATGFIDRTTGIQTLVQMQGLVELVRQFGYVDESRVLDNRGYKRLYNEELMEMVNRRVGKLNRGELKSEDFQLKNAHALLQCLYSNGVILYLASGTDADDVVSEANAMGYAQFFGDRIYGASGDVTHEAKKIVLERIIRDNDLDISNFVTFGDGPVEMRETRKRGGVAVGVASDEVRRYGLNVGKRRRLIRSGADLIISDYGQLRQLMELLNLKYYEG